MAVQDWLAQLPTKEQPLVGGGTWSAPDIAKITGADKVDAYAREKLGKYYEPVKSGADFATDILAYLPKEALRGGYEAGQVLGSKQLSPLEKTGRVAGALLPLGVGVATAGLSGKLLPAVKGAKFLPKLGRSMAKGAMIGGAYGGSSAIGRQMVEGKPLRDVVTEGAYGAGKGAVSGAILSGALTTANQGFNALQHKVSNALESAKLPKNVPTTSKQGGYVNMFSDIAPPELKGKSFGHVLDESDASKWDSYLKKELATSTKRFKNEPEFLKELKTISNVIKTYSDIAHEKIADERKPDAINAALQGFRSQILKSKAITKRAQNAYINNKPVDVLDAVDDIINTIDPVEKTVKFDTFINAQHQRGNILTLNLDMLGSGDLRIRANKAVTTWLDALRDYRKPNMQGGYVNMFENIKKPEMGGKSLQDLFNTKQSSERTPSNWNTLIAEQFKKVRHSGVKSRTEFFKDLDATNKVMQTYSDMANEKIAPEYKAQAIDDAVATFKDRLINAKNTSKVNRNFNIFLGKRLSEGGKKTSILEFIDDILKTQDPTEKAIKFDALAHAQHYRGNAITLILDIHGTPSIMTRVSHAYKNWLDGLRNFRPNEQAQAFQRQSGFFRPSGEWSGLTPKDIDVKKVRQVLMGKAPQATIDEVLSSRMVQKNPELKNALIALTKLNTKKFMAQVDPSTNPNLVQLNQRIMGTGEGIQDNPLKQILTHELQHVIQSKAGKIPSYGSRAFRQAYAKRPWEQEAYKAGRKLFEQPDTYNQELLRAILDTAGMAGLLPMAREAYRGGKKAGEWIKKIGGAR